MADRSEPPKGQSAQHLLLHGARARTPHADRILGLVGDLELDDLHHLLDFPVVDVTLFTRLDTNARGKKAGCAHLRCTTENAESASRAHISRVKHDVVVRFQPHFSRRDRRNERGEAREACEERRGERERARASGADLRKRAGRDPLNRPIRLPLGRTPCPSNCDSTRSSRRSSP